ncbi:hypothetical protein BG006_009420 [Podila minutissima]|uniref:BZIP domain-containing protein n=1 Tax=Podila minutissima TaxID=64525 RepID=A0A9P5SER9_9FUNG|nr:hypothetical protein BG006_009420 [Podila minutissima]
MHANFHPLGDHHSDDEDVFDDDQDKQSVLSHDTRDSTSQPPTKTRKKPGRKPNPASPAVRKEQNRAAQRAFRDRKERHLQQLENMIKELKETHHNATLRFQRESQQLKGIIESLQSENYYLREVVFSFESALGKTGNSAILQDVKAELYRRHYENHAARKVSFAAPQDNSPQPSPSTTSMSADSPATAHMSVPNSVQDAMSQASQVQMLNQALAAAAAAAASNTSLNLQNQASTSTSTSSSTQGWNQMGLEDPQDDNIFSMNSEILYKAPILPSTSSDAGKASSSTASSSSSSSSAFDPLAAVRAATFSPNGPWLPKTTEYTNKPTVFDELQSSLFPAGTLQSVASTSMATPQEIVNDMSLFDQLQESRPSTDSSFSPNQNMFTFSAASMDSAFPSQTPTFLDVDDVDSNEFSMITPNLGFDDGLKQEIIPSHRLQTEIRILASATPAADPNIDPKIYELPHDSRIDLIPCPKLRAQMILHQHEYDIEDLCQLLIGGAICHGHPLDPHNWELPRAFFDRYGYLMGAELMRYKYKVWPKKSSTQRQADMFRTL